MEQFVAIFSHLEQFGASFSHLKPLEARAAKNMFCLLFKSIQSHNVLQIALN